MLSLLSLEQDNCLANLIESGIVGSGGRLSGTLRVLETTGVIGLLTSDCVEDTEDVGDGCAL